MPDYRRAVVPGGTFFFTVVTEGRSPILCSDSSRSFLRAAIEECRQRFPFEIEAFVLLPDHLHPIWRLPDDDSDFSKRWSIIKRRFSQQYVASGDAEQSISESKKRNNRVGVWQRRFWEHAIRDDDDLRSHLDYIHYNPVKHGLVSCPHLWPYSSFHRFVKAGLYEKDWMCVCNGRRVAAPTFPTLQRFAME
jgi:putative transposase